MQNKIHKLGILQRFNGVDILQSRNYIKLSNKTYIEKILKGKNIIEPHSATHPIPMQTDSKYQEQLETAAPASEDEIAALEKQYGFTYRQVIGELIYAMVTCRPDISYALIKLSQYSAHPAAIHYKAANELINYLAATKDDGIHYWRN